jgi:two-component system chemotaxis response regulator CheB
MTVRVPEVTRDIVVIGGSAGALPVLQQIFSELPADFPAAILVVVHQAQSQPGRLPDVLARCGALPAEHATDRAPLELGRIYVAPPDQHLLLERGHMRISRGPKENRFRPAIDPLFRTAARAYGPQVIGVVLSGLLDDGTLGLMRVKQFGGVAIAQDPADADAADMPASAIRNVSCDFILEGNAIASTLISLVQNTVPAGQGAVGTPGPASAPELSPGIPSDTGDTADRGDNALATGHLGGSPSALTCPQCGGAVWEKSENGLITFRCHVGHAYAAESMAAEHDSGLESTLWEAIRMFQESASLHRRMENRARENGNTEMADRYGERSTEQEMRSDLIRHLLLHEGARPLVGAENTTRSRHRA